MSAANNPVRAALWRDLSEAAKRWAANPKAEEGQALSDAAKAWAGSAHPKATDTTAGDATIPFGRSKGTRVVDAETKDLQWVAGALKQSLADPAKERFAPANRALLDAIEHELEGR